MFKSKFIEKAKSIYGDKYSYEKVVYKNRHASIIISCPTHGDFNRTPNRFLIGKGCLQCNPPISSNKIPFEKFIKSIDDPNLVILKEDYSRITKKVKVLCKKHNNYYYQEARNIIKGKPGCKICRKEIRTNVPLKSTLKKRFDDFINKAKEKYKNLYSYERVNYSNSKVDVIITCNNHGDFKTKPSAFLKKHGGCEECKIKYKTEWFISQILNRNNEIYKKQATFNNCVYKGKLRFDFYLSQYKLLIEYDGAQHFNFIKFFHRTEEKFILNKEKDKIKNNFAKLNGYRLIRYNYQMTNQEIESSLEKIISSYRNKIENIVDNDSPNDSIVAI